MLVLSRKALESVFCGTGINRVKFTIIKISGDKVQVGIEADTSVPIAREEAWLTKRLEHRDQAERAAVRGQVEQGKGAD